MARAADITLATADDMLLDFDDLGDGFDVGTGEAIDLGISFDAVGEEAEQSKPEDESMSVEVGRDVSVARSARESLGSHLLGKNGLEVDALSVRSREGSEHPFRNDMDIDFGGDFGGMDLDLGITFDDTALDTTLPEVIQEAGKAEFVRSPSRACALETISPLLNLN